MNILVLGGQGMAGHVIRQYLAQFVDSTVWWTERCQPTAAQAVQLDATNETQLAHVLAAIRPDVVINAIGLLNQAAEQDVESAIQLNSLLPHRLTRFADDLGFRVLHISTDCVFSGRTGRYTETSRMDGNSVYAKTKSLGELTRPPHVTLRTSIVGPELKCNGIGLFHWFMRQTGSIHGYQQVWWNGITTLELAKVMHACLDWHGHGLVHVCQPESISKYQLLQLLQTTFAKRDVHILANTTVANNKTLSSTRSDFPWQPPGYPQMLLELYDWMRTHNEGVYSYVI